MSQTARVERKSPELVVSMDLEMNQPSGKIIQIGCVLCRLDNGKKESEFFRFVNPGEPLSDRIAALTGTREEDLAIAKDLPGAYGELKTWLLPYAGRRALNPMTWGGGDAEFLRGQLGLDQETWIFGRRWIDVKTLHTVQEWKNGRPGAGGLATSMRKYGLSFEGRKHNALDDAWNTFRVFHKAFYTANT